MKIVIIGATAAGTTAAAKARRINKHAEIIIYERGTITSFGACGLPFFVGGHFNESSDLIARTPEEFEKSGIQVKLNHEVTTLNHKERTISGINHHDNKAFSTGYDKLLIATGADASLPPFVKDTLPLGAHKLRSHDDGVILRDAVRNPSVKKITIIGGGFIGLELASELKELHKELTLIELSNRIMATSFDKEITDLMEQELKSNGVNLLLGQKVLSLKGSPVHQVVTEQMTVESDLVIISAGIKPSTSWLTESGLEMLSNGALIVNQKAETNLKDIYAAGDCATVYNFVTKKPSYWPLATVANKLGRIAGENMAGLDGTLDGMLGAASVLVMGLEAERVGLGEEEAIKEGITIGTVFVKDKDHTSYYPHSEDIYVKLIYDQKSNIILGGQVAGRRGAALRAHTLSAAIMGKMTTYQLGLLDLAYSPAFTRTWDVLNVAGNVAK